MILRRLLHGSSSWPWAAAAIKFFPLWFKNDLRMSPAEVRGIYCGVPLSMALASGFLRLSRRIGRVEAVQRVRRRRWYVLLACSAF